MAILRLKVHVADNAIEALKELTARPSNLVLDHNIDDVLGYEIIDKDKTVYPERNGLCVHRR